MSKKPTHLFNLFLSIVVIEEYQFRRPLFVRYFFTSIIKALTVLTVLSIYCEQSPMDAGVEFCGYIEGPLCDMFCIGYQSTARRCDVNSSHTTILSAMHNGSNYWGSVAAIGFLTINLKSNNLQSFCWFVEMNDLSTKRLMFQALSSYNFLQTKS